MLRIQYKTFPLRRPAPTLGGAMSRQLPIFSIGLEGPLGTAALKVRLDSGSDDTVFPLAVAGRIGLDLTGTPIGVSQGVGGAAITYMCASDTLRLSDGKESFIWQAVVGFIDMPRGMGLLGLAGFLDYFDATLLGAARELHLSPNGNFSGQHIIH